MEAGFRLPQVTFRTRVRDDSLPGPNPFRWLPVTTEDLFAGRRAVLFAVAGAFMPVCSTYQLPEYEQNYMKFRDLGIDAICCLAVNDAFVMNRWAEAQGIRNLRMLPDGAGRFTRAMGMLEDTGSQEFGARSRRYAAIIEDGVIAAFFAEPAGTGDPSARDPYGQSAPETLLAWLRARSRDVAAA